jgi:hypothetical protein
MEARQKKGGGPGGPGPRGGGGKGRILEALSRCPLSAPPCCTRRWPGHLQVVRVQGRIKALNEGHKPSLAPPNSEPCSMGIKGTRPGFVIGPPKNHPGLSVSLRPSRLLLPCACARPPPSAFLPAHPSLAPRAGWLMPQFPLADYRFHRTSGS